MRLRTLILCGLTAAAPGAFAEKTIEEVVVQAHPLSGESLAQAANIVEGVELARTRTENIGDTLASQPGIHNSSYGAAAGRPVIHGLSGPRVRIMEDRIDTLDVSVTSADHAVATDPFLADRVEVLKGPSTLLYGSGAIGGVVDVHTGRIPHEVPDALTGGFELRGDDNADGQTFAGKISGGAGSWAWHLDASVRDGDDYEIPGFAESARQRALEEAEHEEEEHEGEENHDEEHGEEEEVSGILPGSFYDTEHYGFGVSRVSDWGFVGVSVSRLEAEYGLPGGHAHAHEEEHEGEENHEEEEHHEEAEDPFATPRLDLEQTRFDLELAIEQPFAWADALNVRIGRNDYEHQEIEPEGEIATIFENEAWEARGELTYNRGDASGVFGLQLMDREFSASGEEAFIAPVDTNDIGAFWLEERPLGRNELEYGVRFGRTEHDPSEDRSRSFSTYALSVGLNVPVGELAKVGILFDHSSRAPVAEELYSNGAHLATQSFERGDNTLDEEKATHLALSLSADGERWSAGISAYATQFSDFIYQQATGLEFDELPEFVYQQTDADFYGIDAELTFMLVDGENFGLETTLFGDLVEAELDLSGNDNVPRLPPQRYGVSLNARAYGFQAGVSYTRADAVDDTAPLELPTGGYDDLDAFVEWSRPVQDATLTLFVQGRNLTDDEQRLHTSFIKDTAPAPGRTLLAGLRLTL